MLHIREWLIPFLLYSASSLSVLEITCTNSTVPWSHGASMQGKLPKGELVPAPLEGIVYVKLHMLPWGWSSYMSYLQLWSRSSSLLIYSFACLPAIVPMWNTQIYSSYTQACNKISLPYFLGVFLVLIQVRALDSPVGSFIPLLVLHHSEFLVFDMVMFSISCLFFVFCLFWIFMVVVYFLFSCLLIGDQWFFFFFSKKKFILIHLNVSNPFLSPSQQLLLGIILNIYCNLLRLVVSFHYTQTSVYNTCLAIVYHNCLKISH